MHVNTKAVHCITFPISKCNYIKHRFKILKNYSTLNKQIHQLITVYNSKCPAQCHVRDYN